MIKNTISILLVVSIVASLFSYVTPLSWYISNYTHINAELCENRHNPEVECNGACQLKKKLDQHQQKSEQAPKNVDTNYRIDFYLTEYSNMITAPVPPHLILSVPGYTVGPGWITDPFSPPPQRV